MALRLTVVSEQREALGARASDPARHRRRQHRTRTRQRLGAVRPELLPVGPSRAQCNSASAVTICSTPVPTVCTSTAVRCRSAAATSIRCATAIACVSVITRSPSALQRTPNTRPRRARYSRSTRRSPLRDSTAQNRISVCTSTYRSCCAAPSRRRVARARRWSKTVGCGLSIAVGTRPPQHMATRTRARVACLAQRTRVASTHRKRRQPLQPHGLA